MTKTIYWAFLLNNISKRKLLEKCKPFHPNVYAEHMTIVFNPTPEQDKILMEQLGQNRTLMIVGIKKDDKGQAVVVTGEKRINGGISHITISTAKNIKPFYSNALLNKGWDPIDPFAVYGVISRYTKNGWANK